MELTYLTYPNYLRSLNYHIIKMQIEQAERFIAGILQSKLSPDLVYHSYFHTEDVTVAAMTLAAEEEVTDEHALQLLRTAALFHDCGYINGYENHEEESCRIAKENLPRFAYDEEDI